MLTFSIVSSGSAQNIYGLPGRNIEGFEFIYLGANRMWPIHANSKSFQTIAEIVDLSLSIVCPLSPDKDHASISRFRECEPMAVSILFVC